MVEDELQVVDLPDAWREESEALLGIKPTCDSDGVLQDIHWSMFLVGYFPTYTLGNLYAAQFHATMIKEIPDWESQIRCGSFSLILEWLQKKIHRHGRIFSANEICQCVTSESLDPKYFINYLKNKYGELYLL
jgi:carboxypeptidase Taq